MRQTKLLDEKKTSFVFVSFRTPTTMSHQNCHTPSFVGSWKWFEFSQMLFFRKFQVKEKTSIDFFEIFVGGDPNGRRSSRTAHYRHEVWHPYNLQHSRREQGIWLCVKRAITTIPVSDSTPRRYYEWCWIGAGKKWKRHLDSVRCKGDIGFYVPLFSSELDLWFKSLGMFDLIESNVREENYLCTECFRSDLNRPIPRTKK